MPMNLSFSFLDLFTFQWLWLVIDNFCAMLVKILMFLPKSTVEIVKDIWLAIGNFWAMLMEEGKELWMKLDLSHTWGQFMAWLDRVLPPEKRPEFIRHVILPVLLFPAAAFLCLKCGLLHVIFMFIQIFFYGIYWVMKCFWGALPGIIKFIRRAISGIIKFCWRAISGIMKFLWIRQKMMKAPGKAGLIIPRPGFEANPRSYFRNLRANPTGSHLC